MSKITLNNISSFQNDSTAVASYTANNATLTTAFDNNLSRDGSTPNQMLSNLDMNSFRILNLPAATLATDPVRVQDLQGFAVSTGNAITTPTSTIVGDYVTWNSTNGSTISGSATNGKPFVILATGQSNFSQAPSFSWTPSAKAKVWNWDGVDTHVGTAFVAPANTTIRVADRFASRIADSYNGPVYLIDIAIASQAIAQWKVGAASPDMFQNILNNITPALAAIGVTTIDVFMWWQGEADALASSTTYTSDWETVYNRFRGQSWFPANTPVMLFGISASPQSGVAWSDQINTALRTVAANSPDLRKFVFPNTFTGGTFWTDAFHMTGTGYNNVGVMAANEFMRGGAWEPLATIANLQTFGRNIAGRNGGLEVWQRLTSGVTTISVGASTTAYTADGWYIANSANQNITVTQVAGLTNGSRFAAKVQRNNGQTGTAAFVFGFPLDSDELIKLKGNSAILSYTVKMGANSTGAITCIAPCGTAAPIKRGLVNFTGEVTPISLSVIPGAGNTVRAVSAVSVVYPTNMNQAEVQFIYTPTGTAGVDDSFTIDDVQLEVVPSGSLFITNPIFERTDYSLDLFRCQRFICAFNSPGTAGFPGFGQCFSTTQAFVVIPYPTPMRVIPTLTVSNVGHFNVLTAVAGTVVCTSVSLNGNTFSNAATVQTAIGSASLVAGNATALQFGNAAGQLLFSSEI